jgi:hypothetical protein
LTLPIRRFLEVLDHPIDQTPAEPAPARLVPRFTIRTLLAMITLAAIVFVMIGTATRGRYWAWGVTIGLVSVIITSLAHAAWFGIVWMFMRMSHAEAVLSESTLRQVGGSRALEATAAASSETPSQNAGPAQP